MSFVALHAAAVAREGSALLLPGPPGAGKTTLTLELLERGWTYLSDDLAPISVSSGMVHPVPKPLHVKDAASWDLWRSRWAVPEWVGPPLSSFLVPVSGFDVAGDPLPVRLIVFPDFELGARLRVTRVGAALALARGAENARAGGPRSRQSTLPVLARLLRHAEAWAMTYGDSSEAADQLVKKAQTEYGSEVE